MKIKTSDIIERRAVVETELRGILAKAEAAGEADLTGEALERWNSLSAERDTLTAQESRAKTRDELDRAGKPGDIDLEKRGTTDDGEAVFGLRPEQRMAQHLAVTTGQPEESLSIGRAVRGIVTGDWSGADAEKRVMGTTSGSVGGFLMPAPISANLIDLARNNAVMVQAGALTIPMASKDLRVVKIVTDPTAAWRAEGATISESDGTFAGINLQAHSLAALVRVNAELLDDVPSFAATLDGMLAAALGLKMDFAALYGSGAGMPLGLRNTEGVQEESMGTDGLAQPDYDKILDLMQKIEEANGAPTTLIQSPRTKTKLAKLKTGIASDLTKLTPPADYAALRKLTSNQVSITETQGNSSAASTTFIGGFEHTAFAIRQNITIEASKVSGTAFEKNQVMVRAIMRGDFVAYRPALLGRLIGIL